MSSSKNNSAWSGALLAFLVMAALGWVLGRGSGDRKSGDESAPSAGPQGDAVSRAQARANAALMRVTSISQGATQEDRMRATIELANNLPTSDFADWVDGGWFDFRSGFELTLFRRIIEERWRLEDPEGFVAWCLEEGRQGGGAMVSNPRSAALPILSEWAMDSPDRMEAYFAKYPDDGLEAQLVRDLAKQNPEAALARFQELMKRGVQHYYMQGALEEIAKSAPEKIEAILDELPTSLRIQAEGALVGQRLANDFGTAFQSLLERPDGFQLFSRNMHRVKDISARVLEELPNLPASWRSQLVSRALHQLVYNAGAEPWLRADLEGAGFTGRQAQQIRSTALRGLANQNPDLAFSMLSEIDLDQQSRTQVIRDLFRRTAQGDRPKAEEWLAQMTSESDLEAARGVMMTECPAAQTDPFASRQNYKNPDEWLEVATSGQIDPQNSWGLGQSLQRWDQQKILDLTERFQELSVEQKDAIATSITTNALGRNATIFAGEIVRHLLENPPETDANDGQPTTTNPNTDPVRLASNTAVRWVIQDSTAATEWVASLPAGDAKLWAQKNMAASWSNYDPDGVVEWVATLPAASRGEVEEFLNKTP